MVPFFASQVTYSSVQKKLAEELKADETIMGKEMPEGQ